MNVVVHEQLVGRVLGGRYRLDRVIGRGGMGVVFQATQLDLARGVAVKVLLDLDSEAIARLRQEALTAGGLSCPFVVSIFDFQAPPDDVAFVVMELLAGESLAALLTRERRLDVGRACRIAMEALIGLDAAHRASVVHRDVKPSNIWLQSGRGMEEQVKLLDFGIAKRVDGSGLQTSTGSVLGTPAYLSPEQLHGLDADARTDQHAIGVVLFEMLTGTRPWRAQAVELLVEIVQRVPPRAHELAPHVPPALSSVIARALAKDPAARFANADELRQALAPFATNDRSSTAMPPSPETPIAQVAPSQRGVETVSFALGAVTPAVKPPVTPSPDPQPSAGVPTPQPKRSLLVPMLGTLGGLFVLGLTATVAYLAWLVQHPVALAGAVDAQAATTATASATSTASATAMVPSATASAAMLSTSTTGLGATPNAAAASDAGAKAAGLASPSTKPKCSCISRFNSLICLRPMAPICRCEDHGSVCPVAFDDAGNCPTDTNFGAFKGPTLKTGDSCSGFKKGDEGATVRATGTLTCNVCYGRPTEAAVPNTACEGLMQGADSPTGKVDKTGLWICAP